MFEILKSDLAGRIGILHTNHGKIETPAYVPVIHPFKQQIPAKEFRKFGFDLVITNSYITKNHYGQEAIERGIHDIIGFDGAVMTDSGGYQVLEYGDVNASDEDMANYQQGIMSDIAIPLDKPTGFGMSKKDAKKYVDYTLKISKKTLKNSSKNGQIWAGPIQGGEHFDLVKKSTQVLVSYDFPLLALGSPVEFMESYEYKLLAKMIIAAKKEIPSSIPLHLFGAGHPLTIPMAVALGCDTFDSASYILYAKHDRYITEDSTRHLSEMVYFSCTCRVCLEFKPKELLSLKQEDRMTNIALHNLFSIKAEVDRVKESIHEGRLWEYVMKKARAHPKLFEAIDVLTQNSDFFVKTTPVFKKKAIFLFTIEDQYRPELLSYHNIVRKFRTKKKTLILTKDSKIKPAYLSDNYKNIMKKFDTDKIQTCQYNPFLGLMPIEITDIYPAAHYVMTKSNFNPMQFPIFAKTWKDFFAKNKFSEIYYDKDDQFIKFFVKLLPKNIKRKSLKNKK